MNITYGARLTSGLRITLAIAVKDIVDALKNRTTITILLGVSTLVLSSLALPMMLGLQKTPTLEVYDDGNSSLVSDLKASSSFSVFKNASLEEMLAELGGAMKLTMGLALPPDFEHQLESEQEVEIQGYYLHWSSPDRISETQTHLEKEISRLVEKPVRINLDGNLVYPSKDGLGLSFMVSVSIVLAITTVGLALVPNLFVEEREKHTLDAIMVTPASAGNFVLGKAIAGVSYCLLAAVVVLAFYPRLVTNWGVAILGSISGCLFAVSIGLLMGITFRSLQVISAWVGALIVVLLLPIYLVIMLGEKLSETLRALIELLPTVALVEIFGRAFTNSASPDAVIPLIGLVFGWSIFLLVIIIWRLRRSEGLT